MNSSDEVSKHEDNSILRRAFVFVAAILLMVVGVAFYFNPLAALLYFLPVIIVAALIAGLYNKLDEYLLPMPRRSSSWTFSFWVHC